jgi:uncharacterized protein (DUF1330 family)
METALAGAAAFDAYQKYQGGKEAEAAYKAQAEEIKQQTAFEQRRALEEVKDIAREGRSAESKAIATAGGSGLRVGGSVATLADRIRAKVARQSAMVAFESSERARRGTFLASQYRYAGKSARRAANVGAFGSLLTGGLDVANYQKKWGKGLWKE